MRKLTIGGLVLLTLIVGSLPRAPATGSSIEIVRFDFTGVVDRYTSGCGGVPVGHEFTGYFEWDTALAADTYGRYDLSGYAATLRLGTCDLRAVEGWIHTARISDGSADVVSVHWTAEKSWYGRDGIPIDIGLLDYSGEALGDGSLPAELSLGSWDVAQVSAAAFAYPPERPIPFLAFGHLIDLRGGYPRPSGEVAALTDAIADLDLPIAIEGSLGVKLAKATLALEAGSPNGDLVAVNTLSAFINEVQAQAGKTIDQSDADALIAAAQQIIDTLTG